VLHTLSLLLLLLLRLLAKNQQIVDQLAQLVQQTIIAAKKQWIT
jgi:hypothetical protein